MVAASSTSPASRRCQNRTWRDAATTAVVVTSTPSTDTNRQEEMASGGGGAVGGQAGFASAVGNGACNAIVRVLK